MLVRVPKCQIKDKNVEVNFPEMFIQKIKICSLKYLRQERIRTRCFKFRSRRKERPKSLQASNSSRGEAISLLRHEPLPGSQTCSSHASQFISEDRRHRPHLPPGALPYQKCLPFSNCPAGESARQHLPFSKTNQLLKLVYRLTGETCGCF